MKTIDKFILKAYVGPMFLTFFFVTFVLLMNVVWLYIDDFVGKGLPVITIVQLLFYMTSSFLPLGIPVATLLAAIMTMGNLGSNNELLAFKASGVSLLRIMRSIIVVAILTSIMSFFVINDYVPYSFSRARNLLYDVRNQKQEIEFRDGVFFNGIPNISIRVGKQDKDTKLITDVLIYDTRDRNTTKTIVADSGYITLVDNNKYLKIKLFNGQNYEDNRSYSWYTNPTLSHHKFNKQEILMELVGFSFEESDRDVSADSSEAKDLVELGRDIDSLGVLAKISISRVRKELVEEYIYSADTLVINNSDTVRQKRNNFIINATSIDTLSNDVKERIFKEASNKLDEMKMRSNMGHSTILRSTFMLYRSMADWHRKFTLPVSVFVFFLIGAPMGAIIRKGGIGIPAIVGVLSFVLNYVISMSAEKLVKDGAWSPIFGMWLPTIVFLPIALFLTYKALTDSSLLSIDAYYIFFNRHITRARTKWKFVDKLLTKKPKKVKNKKLKK